jgi:hypothetical protein
MDSAEMASDGIFIDGCDVRSLRGHTSTPVEHPSVILVPLVVSSNQDPGCTRKRSRKNSRLAPVSP